jgi:hypothetical protein
VAPIRKLIVRVTIGSFSLAALMGIIALLGGGDFGDVQGDVLLTTLLVGVVSIGVLCYLATAGRPSQPVGVAGGVVVLVPLVTGLLLIWSDVEDGSSEMVLKTFGVGAVAAATLAQASLLLVLAERGRPVVRRLLVGTLVFAALLAAMTSALIVGWNSADEDFYARLLGVVAILDVLGTVVVAALAKFGSADGDRLATEFRLPADLAERVAERASASGLTGDQVIATAVQAYLTETP